LEGVRGGLGAKKCYGTRCFFFKIDFSSKNWGKMKLAIFASYKTIDGPNV